MMASKLERPYGELTESRTGRHDIGLSDGTTIRLRVYWMETPCGRDSNFIERIEEWITRNKPGLHWTWIEEIAE